VSSRIPPADRPAPSPLRTAVERRSAVLLVVLSRAPKAAVPLASAALLAGALLLPTALGLVCLVLLVALVGWLSYLSWPAVPQGARVVRLVLLALLVVLGLRAVLA
jgi:hypothetical protein